MSSGTRLCRLDEVAHAAPVAAVGRVLLSSQDRRSCARHGASDLAVRQGGHEHWRRVAQQPPLGPADEPPRRDAEDKPLDRPVGPAGDLRDDTPVRSGHPDELGEVGERKISGQMLQDEAGVCDIHRIGVDDGKIGGLIQDESAAVTGQLPGPGKHGGRRINADDLIEMVGKCATQAAYPASEVEGAPARDCWIQGLQPIERAVDFVPSGCQERLEIPSASLGARRDVDSPQRIGPAQDLPVAVGRVRHVRTVVSAAVLGGG